MLSLAPVAYFLGLQLTVFGGVMLAPAAVEFLAGSGQWKPYVLAAYVTMALGMLCVLAFRASHSRSLAMSQAVLLLVSTWIFVPAFGSLPFLFVEDGLSVTDAYFESMSGLTTTGSTVLSGLDERSSGVLLWRGLLQWIGGIFMVVIAIAFLPRLAVGGMQLFRGSMSQSSGGNLLRLRSVFTITCAIYFGLTVACGTAYALLGMDPFEATVHAMTTMATGGFSTRDASFAAYSPGIIVTSVVFMILAGFPFLRYIQLVGGRLKPLLLDSQIHTFLGIILATVLALAAWRAATLNDGALAEFHHILFNVVSILTGTGYASADYGAWGGFAMTVFFLLGLVGGCAGSTTCSVKVFRYQILASSLLWQIRRIETPSRVTTLRYQGEPVSEDVVSSVTSFLFMFTASLVILTILLSLAGLDLVTASSGAATALANVGPGLGDVIGPQGNFETLPDAAKWILAGGMLLGRLEILAVLVLFQLSFWKS